MEPAPPPGSDPLVAVPPQNRPRSVRPSTGIDRCAGVRLASSRRSWNQVPTDLSPRSARPACAISAVCSSVSVGRGHIGVLLLGEKLLDRLLTLRDDHHVANALS